MKYVSWEAKYNFKSNFMPSHMKNYTKLSVYTYKYIYKKRTKINGNLDKKKQSKVKRHVLNLDFCSTYNVHIIQIPLEYQLRGDFAGRQLTYVLA